MSWRTERPETIKCREDTPEIETILIDPVRIYVRFKSGDFTIYRWSARRILDKPNELNPDVKRPMSEVEDGRETHPCTFIDVPIRAK